MSTPISLFHVLILTLSRITATQSLFLPSIYEFDHSWKPLVPLNVSGVSAVAVCPDDECAEVYVAQRGGTTPIVVLHAKSGAFIRTFGTNHSTNASLIQHVHGLSWAIGAPGGANLWATDAGWLPKSKLFGFHAGSGTLVTQFGKQGTEIYPALQYGNIADTSFALNGSTVFIADGDMGINNRVSRLDLLDAVAADADADAANTWSTTWVVGNNHTPGSDPNHYCSPGGPGNPYNDSSAFSNCNYSSPHSLAYDQCWNQVYVADRDHSRVVMLDSVTGEQYSNHWGLEDLLGPLFSNVSDPSMMRVWSVRAA
eukprot:gene23454-23310_t